MPPIKTGLVGFGISGQSFQTPIITACSEFDLSAVVSSDATKVHRQLPNAQVYSQLEDLLADSDIELVIISTPNHRHIPQAKLALKAGKHVVVEKPFSVSSEEAKELIILANQLGKQLSVYQSRRFDGDFRTIQALMKDGSLNDIHTFYSSYNRFRPEVKVRWREQDIPGAGILYDLGAHLIDQALCLFGTPDKVTAILKNQRPNAQAVDHFHVILHYPQCEAILHGNCLSTAEGPRFQVFAENGTFIKYGMDRQEDMLRELKGPDSKGWGEDLAEHFGSYTDESGSQKTIETKIGGYQDFYHQLAQAIRHGDNVPIEPEQALDVIRVIEAAYQSAHEQKTVELSPLSGTLDTTENLS